MPRPLLTFLLLLSAACAPKEQARSFDAPDSTMRVRIHSPSTTVDTAEILPRGLDWVRQLDSLAPNPFPPALARWVARFDGVGPVTVGQSVAEATIRYGEGFTVPAGTEGCDYLPLPGAPRGVDLMIEIGQLVRIDISDARVATDRGIRIGDTESDVRRAYAGLVTQQSHPYAGPEWHYLIVQPSDDSTHSIIFETNGWRVLSYRVGLTKPVHYIEGCS